VFKKQNKKQLLWN